MLIRFGKSGSDGPRGDAGLIAEVRAYWEALRENGQLPERHRIDPRGMAGALENSFLIERIGPGLAQFRIAGMAFLDLTGMDVRGLPLSCLFMGEARPRLQLELERVFHGPSILSLELEAPKSFTRPSLGAHMVILPLADRGGNCTQALGCLDLRGAIGKAGRRFAICDALTQNVVQPARPAPEDSAFQGISLPIAAPRNAAKGAHLRLVHSAK